MYKHELKIKLGRICDRYESVKITEYFDKKN